MAKLSLTNTLTRKKQEFSSLEKNKIKMYVCGITPYDFAHIGHGRCYVTFDILFRLLSYLGFQITYVRNFTDIDDKLIERARVEGHIYTYIKIAEKFELAFEEDFAALNCLKPQVEPKVTENIPQILEFIEELVDQDIAYQLDNDVYFDITRFDKYGKLSGRRIEDLLMGARVEPREGKRNSGDFALWKGNQDGLFWQSPWGFGRPGWHIECSALARTHLGEQIDIHGGGMDLIFPHHENEIAQTESLTQKEFAQFWIHNAFVNINKEKMSKSLGNFFALRDIFAKFHPMVLRFYYIQHQYRNPMDFSFDDLEAAKKAYNRLSDIFDGVELVKDKPELTKQIVEAICDDLNTPKMLGIVFENLSLIQKDKDLAGSIKAFLEDIVGLKFYKVQQEVMLTPEIDKLLAEREIARTAKDWKRADAIRDKLKELGYEIQDKKLS